MINEFPKAYEPNSVESKWYKIWNDNNLFDSNRINSTKNYSILMPPPNVTGILHFGHVLNMTIQDMLIRRKRMQGYNVCWFPGTDHAGIATQTRVEKEIAAEGLTKYDLGREKFLERVWQFKEKYGSIIIEQIKTIGASCDWNKQIFTMDEAPSYAVREVFIKLFEEGLIYKGKRIINWSPLSQTALSDEEVDFREVKEHLYTMRYYFDNGVDYITVSTARPETIFGDIAIAVNPNDERFKHLLGQFVCVPLVGRRIPIIADDYADPEFGTGCVKITPAHDPNDFEVGLRHNLEIINTINPDGTLNEMTGKYANLDRFVARKQIVEDLNKSNLIEKTEDYVHNVGFSQRGGEPIEPYLSDQWFVSMKPLAAEALEKVTSGQIRFHPHHWVKTYEHWMNNIRDWCISRQLWWGHRIPVYYSEDGRFVAAHDEQSARIKLNLDDSAFLSQDTDVLDTWFSSWIWPMTTMQWLHDGVIDETDDMKRFLPTDLLVTAPDIIFFWVARMIMATSHFKNTIPFTDVYFTSLIRDGKGRKLSKSLGNSPDPLNVIDKYGADAVRFTMIYLSPLGLDVRMEVDIETQDIPSMEIGRNFCNKIWNAGRFLLMKKEQIVSDTGLNNNTILLPKDYSTSDKWIASRLNNVLKSSELMLSNYKVNDYSKALYDFIWRDFCDWYVEIVKVQTGQDAAPERRIETINFAIHVYETILQLIHPIMPFISEEIWHLLNQKSENESISTHNIADFDDKLIDTKIESNFMLLQTIIEETRKLRASKNIPPSKKLPLTISCKNEEIAQFFQSENEIVAFLGRCSEVKVGVNVDRPSICLTTIVHEIELYLEIGEAIDIEQEKIKLSKEIERLKNLIISGEKKLSNEKFMSNAAPEVIQSEQEKLASLKVSLTLAESNLNSL
ncbi:MAG: valine--tRNA ligase [Ignavibacteriae bacterium HGW-Ignavibacteriae-1]|jgi:valyl-tRNA synthetase|nr:MAG: valine--tRNA ligase [Ignavibacteriae bacterium HGW-Ignavibacteriae-1]